MDGTKSSAAINSGEGDIVTKQPLAAKSDENNNNTHSKDSSTRHRGSETHEKLKQLFITSRIWQKKNLYLSINRKK